MQDHRTKIKMGTDIAKQAIVVLVLVLSAASVSFGKYGGGTGEPNDPYRIATANDLNDIGNHVEDFNKCFVMVNDINLAGYTGTQFNIIGPNSTVPFAGVFDGNGCSISNFTYSTSSSDIGIFGYMDDPCALVMDVILADPCIVGGENVGPMVARIEQGRVIGCVVRGGELRTGSYSGGLVGYNVNGLLERCSSTCGLWGDRAGGLIGFNRGDVRMCWAKCDITGTLIGGLVFVNTGQIESCFAAGTCSGGNYVGGLVSNNEGVVRNSYSLTDVQGDWNVGGLAYSNDGELNHCYAAGEVSGNHNSAGLVCSSSSTAFDSFWDVNSSGEPNSAGGTGKTTAQMQTKSTFTDASWDFVEVWDIGENQTYPFLRVHSVGDLNHDDKVNWLDLAILAGHWLEGT